MATILNGKELSNKLLTDLTEKVANLQKVPHLAVILVGCDPASELYVGMKEKVAKKLGIKSTVIKLDNTISEKELLNKIEELNNNNDIDAILVQMPVPKHINSQNIIRAIAPQKDVDGFTPYNMGLISIAAEPYAYPCTPKGILRLLDEYNIELEGKNVVIIGRSNIVGKPLALMMLNKNATVTICHSKTKDLASKTKTADIIISAVGRAKLITSDMIKHGSVVIDVGVSKVNGKIVGDIDFENLQNICDFITPNPGGVGPMTIASLMENTLNLAINRMKGLNF